MENTTTELTEIEKVEKLIADNKVIKDQEFADKFQALMVEYGKEITTSTTVNFVNKK